jgi:hypothetical protein
MGYDDFVNEMSKSEREAWADREARELRMRRAAERELRLAGVPEWLRRSRERVQVLEGVAR